MIHESHRTEFGDFQTPSVLATRVIDLLRSDGLSPRTIVEPTCGIGSFVAASLSGFPQAEVVAYDINPEYVEKTSVLEKQPGSRGRLTCRVANFFTHDWSETLAALPEPILIVGNPPWVTASELGALGGENLPKKSNFQNMRGLDALTGKSNFDVAEWMLLRLLDGAQSRDVTMAMLVKTSVARRVLSRLWTTGANVSRGRLLAFDASAYFGASADACLFLCTVSRTASSECFIATLDQPDTRRGTIAWRDGRLVSDSAAYDRHKSLLAGDDGSTPLRWRSGVKHDCSAIMELAPVRSGGFVNGYGARVELEPDYVYPLLKGTDLVHGRVKDVRKWLLITQSRPGEDTSIIARRAPKTWTYLRAHGAELDRRRSSIYRTRPRFSIFGVGPYTFTPWKVAISALHKRLWFRVVGPLDGRPVVFDDTCYQLSCVSEAHAELVARLLNSDCSRELLGAMVFWDGKRPITTGILQRLDLRKVAERLELVHEYDDVFASARGVP